jgi:3-isopropylmalate/(R)-2-methylmalate dehydratase small subunit
MEIIRGRVWKYGDNVNTDVIFPGKYTYTISEPAEMPAHALEDLDPNFAGEVKPGDIIVAGKNWGCGSSREQAVTCLKEGNLGAIIAESFARIYYRNCLNAALPALICPEAVQAIQDGEQVEIDLDKGEIRTSNGNYAFNPLPEIVREIFDAGGLIAHTKKRLEGSQR